MTPDHIPLRDTRDRVIDLLGFGQTAPLRDVRLSAPELVPVDTSTLVTIEPGQLDVRYLLRSRDGDPVGAGFHVKGTGATTHLPTPAITDSVTYRVLARRVQPNTGAPREAYLHDMVAVKVGLDITLAARILAPLLEPRGSGSDSEPRIVDHGAALQVEIDQSQVGVSYEVVILNGDGSTNEVVSTAPVVGNQATITVVTHPMTEDSDLRVRASRADPGPGDQVEILDAVLPLKVRADIGLKISITNPIIEHEASAALMIDSTQATVSYQVWRRRLSRLDFVYGADTLDTIAVEVPDEPSVHIERVADGVVDHLEAVGTSHEGTGGDMEIDLGPTQDDQTFVVVATKPHGGTPASSRLTMQAAVLTRPNPHQTLSLVVPITNGAVSAPFTVRGGQPGVFYAFGREAGEIETGHPGFFPEPDLAGQPVGVGVLRIGVDWFVRHDGHGRDPLVSLDDGTIPAELHVRAMKARTRVPAEMSMTAEIEDMPIIRTESNSIAAGGLARIVVAASITGQRYQPYIGDEPMRRARNGDGSDLVFQSEPLTADTTIVVRVQPNPSSTSITVERHVTFFVQVV